MKTWFFLLMLSFLALQGPLWALDLNEQLDILVTRVHNESVIELNRGLEDGVARGEHIKIYDREGTYVARGVCLKSRLTKSYWLAYHVVDARRLVINQNMALKQLDKRLMPRIVRQKVKAMNVQKALIREHPQGEPLARDDSQVPFDEGESLGVESMGLLNKAN